MSRENRQRFNRFESLNEEEDGEDEEDEPPPLMDSSDGDEVINCPVEEGSERDEEEDEFPDLDV
eukprot:8217315-Karenia_brevis.AAC.1